LKGLSDSESDDDSNKVAKRISPSRFRIDLDSDDENYEDCHKAGLQQSSLLNEVVSTDCYLKERIAKIDELKKSSTHHLSSSNHLSPQVSVSWESKELTPQELGLMEFDLKISAYLANAEEEAKKRMNDSSSDKPYASDASAEVKRYGELCSNLFKVEVDVFLEAEASIEAALAKSEEETLKRRQELRSIELEQMQEFEKERHEALFSLSDIVDGSGPLDIVELRGAIDDKAQILTANDSAVQQAESLITTAQQLIKEASELARRLADSSQAQEQANLDTMVEELGAILAKKICKRLLAADKTRESAKLQRVSGALTAYRTTRKREKEKKEAETAARAARESEMAREKEERARCVAEATAKEQETLNKLIVEEGESSASSDGAPRAKTTIARVKALVTSAQGVSAPSTLKIGDLVALLKCDKFPEKVKKIAEVIPPDDFVPLVGPFVQMVQDSREVGTPHTSAGGEYSSLGFFEKAGRLIARGGLFRAAQGRQLMRSALYANSAFCEPCFSVLEGPEYERKGIAVIRLYASIISSEPEFWARDGLDWLERAGHELFKLATSNSAGEFDLGCVVVDAFLESAYDSLLPVDGELLQNTLQRIGRCISVGDGIKLQRGSCLYENLKKKYSISVQRMALAVTKSIEVAEENAARIRKQTSDGVEDVVSKVKPLKIASLNGFTSRLFAAQNSPDPNFLDQTLNLWVKKFQTVLVNAQEIGVEYLHYALEEVCARVMQAINKDDGSLDTPRTVAKFASRLAKSHPDLRDFMRAKLYKECPLIVPELTEESTQRRVSDLAEASMKRQFASFTACLPYSCLFGLDDGWSWLAQIINYCRSMTVVPRVIITLLEIFITGGDYWNKCKIAPTIPPAYMLVKKALSQKHGQQLDSIFCKEIVLKSETDGMATRGLVDFFKIRIKR
jgi:hypothetical protein